MFLSFESRISFENVFSQKENPT